METEPNITASENTDSNSIGWDPSLTKKDANDYSRFDNIKDDDEESKDKKAPAPVATCGNCRSTSTSSGCAMLKCSICKKARYCSRDCQKQDWKYHKRICKKPEPPKPKKPTAASSTNTSTHATASTKSTPVKKSSTAPTKIVVDDEEDLGNMKGYKNGLPYFHTTLDDDAKELIGDIAPKKITPAAAIPIAAASAAVPATTHEGSAWNSSGTFEERNFTEWAKKRLNILLKDSINNSMMPHDVSVTSVTDLDGEASICVIRGTKRYLFDFSFKLNWTVSLDGKKFSGKLVCQDISNSDDFDLSCQGVKKIMHEETQQQVSALVASPKSVLHNELRRQVEVFTAEFQKL